LCVGGSYVCNGAVNAAAELCDGKDNDCNGVVDDVLTGAPCGSSVGECKQGITTCVTGALTCQGQSGPTAELSDSRDNDCDGIVDEDLISCP
jgi:hypothetical protein